MAGVWAASLSDAKFENHCYITPINADIFLLTEASGILHLLESRPLVWKTLVLSFLEYRNTGVCYSEHGPALHSMFIWNEVTQAKYTMPCILYHFISSLLYIIVYKNRCRDTFTAYMYTVCDHAGSVGFSLYRNTAVSFLSVWYIMWLMQRQTKLNKYRCVCLREWLICYVVVVVVVVIVGVFRLLF